MTLFHLLNKLAIKEYFHVRKNPKIIIKEMMSLYEKAKLNSILGSFDKNQISYKSQGHEIYFHHKEGNRKYQE